jgi:hypothetical protein
VVAGLAARDRREKCALLRLFSIDPPCPSTTSGWARAIADHLGTKHEELAIAHIDPFELLESARLFDQPSAIRQRI